LFEVYRKLVAMLLFLCIGVMEIHAKLHTSEMTWLHGDHVLCALVTSLGTRQLSVWNQRRASMLLLQAYTHRGGILCQVFCTA